MVNKAGDGGCDTLDSPLLSSAEDASCARVRQLAAWRVLTALCGVAFTSNVIISLIAPILPPHFEMLGISQIWCGVMFSCFPTAMLLASPLAIRAMARYGRPPVLFAGLVLQGVTSISFGYADELTGGSGAHVEAALAVYTLSRLLCGAGGACANNAIFSMAADRFPDTLGKVMGLNEVVIGAGFSLGPPIGTALLLKYGFNIVFLTSGLAILIFAPFTLTLWQPRRPGDRSSAANELELARGGLTEVLTPGLLCGGLCLLLGTGVFGVVEPILGLYLRDEVGVGPAASGGIFAVFAFAYSLAGPLAGAMADRLGALRVCAAGSLAAGAIMAALLGPTASFLQKGSTARISYEIVVLVILGIAQAATLIPSLPAMKDSVTLKSESATERVVAWFNMFMQLGLVIGPLLGCALRDAFGFEVACAAFGVLVALYGAAALAFACRGRAPHSAELHTPTHLVTGVMFSPKSPHQRQVSPEKVLSQLSV